MVQMDDVMMSKPVDNGKEQYEQEQHERVEHARHNKSSGDSEGRHDRCRLWMKSHHLGWLTSLPKKWPRIFSLIFGVVSLGDGWSSLSCSQHEGVQSAHTMITCLFQVMPLWLLIGVSLFFGYGLAQLEAPAEIDGDNDVIANRALVDATTQFRSNVTERLPQICLDIFTQNVSVSETLELEFDEIFARVLDRQAQTPVNSSEVASNLDLSRSSELLGFMLECGKTGLDTADKFTFQDMESGYVGESLSFNWIRCDGLGLDSSKKLYQQIWGRPFADVSRLQPDAQEAAAVLEWRRSRQELYNEYMKDLVLADGTRPVGARLLAFRQSLEYANGFSHCYPNSAAGAWFWFTVMTTIGYGNTAPTTEGGRTMIYTLGFFSILLFAGVLGTAGTIVVAIWDDFVDRTKLHQLNIPWVGCIFWGFCYYSWMLVVASYTQSWKAERLGQEPEFSEMYWFSYISTTTVGLGDNYLEHDVILRQDLITFPLLFLTGFVLLANFFVKLTEVLTQLVPRNQPTLEEKLADSDVPCFPKAAKKAVTKPLKFIGSIALSGRSNPALERDDDSDEMSDSENMELASTLEAQHGNAVADRASNQTGDKQSSVVELAV